MQRVAEEKDSPKNEHKALDSPPQPIDIQPAQELDPPPFNLDQAPVNPDQEIDLQWLMSTPLGTALTLYTAVIDRLNVFMWGHPELRTSYLDVLPFIKDLVMLLGAGIGAYYFFLEKKEKDIDTRRHLETQVKSFLRAVPIAFAVSEVTIQAGYNEIWPNENSIENDWFYLGICAFGILTGIYAGKRFPKAHEYKAQDIEKKCKPLSLWFFDTLLRGFYYATILSAGFLYTFDNYVYTDDVNKSFQRAWEASLLGIPISFIQAFIKEDPQKKDHPLLIAAVLSGFIYKVCSRLLKVQNPIFLSIEIALWTIVAITSFIMLKNHPKLPEYWKSLTNTPSAIKRSISFSLSGSGTSTPQPPPPKRSSTFSSGLTLFDKGTGAGSPAVASAAAPAPLRYSRSMPTDLKRERGVHFTP